MPMEAEKFDGAMSAWRAWQEAPWGRLRYATAEANLARRLDEAGPAPLRILDLAGGDGADALRLAGRGHRVVIADYAPAMLAAAAERAAQAGVSDLVTGVRADALNLPEELVRGDFDVVLCHNLVQYREDLRETLAAALAPLRPGGLLSVITVNRDSNAFNLAVRTMDPAAALAALDDPTAHTALFDSTVTLRSAQELIPELESLGCGRITRYGIRSFCDYIVDDERKQDPAFFADLERLELAAADREPYVRLARFVHLVAVKDAEV